MAVDLVILLVVLPLAAVAALYWRDRRRKAATRAAALRNLETAGRPTATTRRPDLPPDPEGRRTP